MNLPPKTLLHFRLLAGCLLAAAGACTVEATDAADSIEPVDAIEPADSAESAETFRDEPLPHCPACASDLCACSEHYCRPEEGVEPGDPPHPDELGECLVSMQEVCAAACMETPLPGTIEQYIEIYDDLHWFREALVLTDLVEVFSGEERFTLLAPHDWVFESLAPEQLEVLFSSPDLLREVILTHSIEGSYSYAELGQFESLAPLLDGKPLPLPFARDIGAANGQLHVIDQLRLPEL